MYVLIEKHLDIYNTVQQQREREKVSNWKAKRINNFEFCCFLIMF